MLIYGPEIFNCAHRGYGLELALIRLGLVDVLRYVLRRLVLLHDDPESVAAAQLGFIGLFDLIDRLDLYSA